MTSESTHSPLVVEMTAALNARGDVFTGGVVWDVANDWAEHFDDADEAAGWMDVGFWDAGAAAAVRRLGLTPEQAAARAAELIEECEDAAEVYTDGDPIYAVCNCDASADVLLPAAE